MDARTTPVRRSTVVRMAALALAAVLAPASADAETRAGREKFEIILAQRVANGNVPSAELERSVREEIETREALAAEAKRRAIDLRSAVRKEMEQAEQAAIRRLRDRPHPLHSQQTHVDLARETVLVRAAVADFLSRETIAEDELRREYAKLFASAGGTEYFVHHVLAATVQDAADVAARLQEGTPFAIVARERSIDAGSRDRGGELGWNVPASFEKPFADAMVASSPGKWSQPVRTSHGWHVILVTDTRPTRGPTFEQARGDLLRRVQTRRVERYITELRSAAAAGADGPGITPGTPR